jgi:hypothetical protein
MKLSEAIEIIRNGCEAVCRNNIATLDEYIRNVVKEHYCHNPSIIENGFSVVYEHGINILNDGWLIPHIIQHYRDGGWVVGGFVTENYFFLIVANNQKGYEREIILRCDGNSNKEYVPSE